MVNLDKNYIEQVVLQNHGIKPNSIVPFMKSFNVNDRDSFNYMCLSDGVPETSKVKAVFIGYVTASIIPVYPSLSNISTKLVLKHVKGVEYNANNWACAYLYGTNIPSGETFVNIASTSSPLMFNYVDWNLTSLQYMNLSVCGYLAKLY